MILKAVGLLGLVYCATQLPSPQNTKNHNLECYGSSKDMNVMATQDKLRERGVFDTLRRDFMVAFRERGFDPMHVSNPFPENGSLMHIWQGYEDRIVPFELQRYVYGKVAWIEYHEVPDGGHLIVHYKALWLSVYMFHFSLSESSLHVEQMLAHILWDQNF
ncbi:uncharacterized protein LOC111783588 [Cucurbita pepo subsp. pepo]|uniref:uncharacterized protein LOC111783588 n=1 Tax=Cucurbita pepo subsp. pepo TaxID=3664 RepID=UPI000C9D3A6D|nr:uncharacterized protein LOC111783588 [Cucurbita pepo subsp. pepo]